MIAVDTVTIRHPDTGHTSTVPASSLPTWVTGGWELVDKPPSLPRRRSTKKPPAPAPVAPAADAEPTPTDAAPAADPESET